MCVQRLKQNENIHTTSLTPVPGDRVSPRRFTMRTAERTRLRRKAGRQIASRAAVPGSGRVRGLPSLTVKDRAPKLCRRTEVLLRRHASNRWPGMMSTDNELYLQRNYVGKLSLSARDRVRDAVQLIVCLRGYHTRKHCRPWPRSHLARPDVVGNHRDVHEVLC